MHAPGARTLSLLGFFIPQMAAMRVRECVCLRAAQLRVRGARREAVGAPEPLLCVILSGASREPVARGARARASPSHCLAALDGRCGRTLRQARMLCAVCVFLW